MRVGVIGINHKLADLLLREKLAKACQKLFSAGSCLHVGHHFILLSTCNRTEVYFSSDDLPTSHIYLLSLLRREVEEEFEHRLYSYFGSDCFAHLVRVSAGLDSAIVAETEIQGQVKTAYEISLGAYTLPKDLHILFQKSLMIAKKIRSELNLGRGMPNLEHAIYSTGNHFFKSPENASVLFVGASEINQKILGYLQTKKVKGITLCNRTLGYAKELSQLYDVALLEWNCLQSEWHHYDWVIFGTKSPDFIISKSMTDHPFKSHKLIMDLSVPRNVDPWVGKDRRITLLNIDQINRLLKLRTRTMNETLTQAEKMVQTATEQHLQRQEQREQSKLLLFTATA